MDVVWSREFLVALLSFMAPVMLGAALVCRRMLKSDLRRRRNRVRMTEAHARRALGEGPLVAAVPAAAAVVADPVAPATLQSLEQPLENLRQCLVAFRSSIQQSRSALAELQECDSRFSLDLGRASQVMHHAFTR